MDSRWDELKSKNKRQEDKNTVQIWVLLKVLHDNAHNNYTRFDCFEVDEDDPLETFGLLTPIFAKAIW